MADAPLLIRDGKLAEIIYSATVQLINDDIIAGVLNTAVRNFNAGKLTDHDAMLAISQIAALRRFLDVLATEIKAGREALATVV